MVSVVLPGTEKLRCHFDILVSPQISPTCSSENFLLSFSFSASSSITGSISTPIWNKSTTHLVSLLHQTQHQSTRASAGSLAPTAVEYYTKLLLQYASINRIAQATASPPSAVSDVVCKALGAWFPKDRWVLYASFTKNTMYGTMLIAAGSSIVYLFIKLIQISRWLRCLPPGPSRPHNTGMALGLDCARRVCGGVVMLAIHNLVGGAKKKKQDLLKRSRTTLYGTRRNNPITGTR